MLKTDTQGCEPARPWGIKEFGEREKSLTTNLTSGSHRYQRKEPTKHSGELAALGTEYYLTDQLSL
jgi:hypothetical protein